MTCLHVGCMPASSEILKRKFSVVFEEDAMLVPKVALCPDDWLRAAVPSSHRRLAWLGFLVWHSKENFCHLLGARLCNREVMVRCQMLLLPSAGILSLSLAEMKWSLRDGDREHSLRSSAVARMTMHQMGQKRDHPQNTVSIFPWTWVCQPASEKRDSWTLRHNDAASSSWDDTCPLLETWWTQLTPVLELPAKWGHAALVLLFLHGATRNVASSHTYVHRRLSLCC